MSGARVTYARLFGGEDGFDEELFERMLAEPIAPLPRPAPVPDLGAETARAQRAAGTLPTARARGGAR